MNIFCVNGRHNKRRNPLSDCIIFINRIVSRLVRTNKTIAQRKRIGEYFEKRRIFSSATMVAPSDAAVPPENSPFIARTRPRAANGLPNFSCAAVADNKHPDQKGWSRNRNYAQYAHPIAQPAHYMPRLSRASSPVHRTDQHNPCPVQHSSHNIIAIKL